MKIHSYKAVSLEDIAAGYYNSSPCYKQLKDAVKYIFEEDYKYDENYSNLSFEKFFELFEQCEIDCWNGKQFWRIEHHEIEI